MTLAAHVVSSGGRADRRPHRARRDGATAVRAKGAERALEGRALDPSNIDAAVAAVTEGTSPIDDLLASAWYRREVVGVHLRRLLNGQL